MVRPRQCNQTLRIGRTHVLTRAGRVQLGWSRGRGTGYNGPPNFGGSMTQIRMRNLVYEVVGYGLGAAVNRALGIVVACIYPILLSRDEYGRLDVVFSVTSLLTILFFLGLDAALARFYYEHEDKAERKRLVSTVFCTVMGFTVAAVALLLVFSRPLALWLYGDSRYILYLRLALAAMPFTMANGVQLVVLRLERRVRAFNLIMIANLVTASVIGIGSILLFKIGAAGMLAGFIAGNLATAVAGMLLNRRQIFALPAPAGLGALMGIGLPLVLSGTAFWLIGYVNRPILVHRVPADDLGLYAIASGGVGMMSLLMGAFRNAWQPFAFSIMGREGSQSVYGRTLTLFTAVAATIAVCGTLFAPEALLVINAYTHKNWSGAAVAVGPLAMGTLFSAMFYVVQIGVYITRRTSVIALAMGLAVMVNLALNFVLIPRFGITGAALATALGHLSAFTTLSTLAQRLMPIPYQWGKLTAIVLSAAAIVLLAPEIPTGSVIRDMLLKTVVLALYGLALLAFRAVTLNDLALLLKLDWRKRGRPLSD